MSSTKAVVDFSGDAQHLQVATDFLIDGMLSGTGVRNALEGGYIDLCKIGLSGSLISDIATWQQKYEAAHFAGFPDDVVADLDKDGLRLLSRARAELPDKNLGYYSNGRMMRLA